MITTNPIIRALKTGLLIAGLSALAFLSLSGQKVLPDISIPFDFYTATTNASGIAFYQKQQHISYLVSPYNDYSITNGRRAAFIPVGQEKNTTVTRYKNQFPFNIYYQILAYIGNGTLEYQSKHTDIVRYNGTVSNNILTITRTITFDKTPLKETDMTITLLYSRDDVIINQLGILMTESTEDSITLFSKDTGINIQRGQSFTNRVVQSEGNTIRLFNPHTAGTIVVSVPRAENVVVNNATKLVEFIDENPSLINDTYTITMTIQVEHASEGNEI